jgi:hypothetical protein
MVLKKISTLPYYKIWGVGETLKKIAMIDGL